MSLEGVAGGRNVGRPLPEIPSHAAQKFQVVAQEIDHVAGPILRGVTPGEGPSHPIETSLVLVSSDDILGNPPDDPWAEIDAFLSEKVDIPTVSEPPEPRSSRLSYDEDSGHLMPFRREATPKDLALDELWVVYPGKRNYSLGEKITARSLLDCVASATRSVGR